MTGGKPSPPDVCSVAVEYHLGLQTVSGVTGHPRALTAGADNPDMHDRLLMTTGSVIFRPTGTASGKSWSQGAARASLKVLALPWATPPVFHAAPVMCPPILLHPPKIPLSHFEAASVARHAEVPGVTDSAGPPLPPPMLPPPPYMLRFSQNMPGYRIGRPDSSDLALTCMRCVCGQDTPGYRDSLDLDANIRIVLSHIEAQNVKWLQLEQSRGRRQDLREAEDPRIDLCIFCIGPHRWVGEGRRQEVHEAEDPRKFLYIFCIGPHMWVGEVWNGWAMACRWGESAG